MKQSSIKKRPNDYKSMRIISDELHAKLVRELAKNETVAVFQQLLLAPKQEESEADEAAEKAEGKGGEE